VLTRQKRYWVFSISLLFLTIIAKIFFLAGSVFNLDYGLFHPDGMLYSFKALTFLGYSQNLAGSEVSRFYLDNAVGNPEIPPQSLFFENNSNWSVFQLRILYPFLSAPFVYFLGLWGMLVLPIASFVTLWSFATLKLRQNQNLGIVVLLVLSGSTTVSRWMFSNTSDPLLVGMFTIYIWLMPRLMSCSKFVFMLVTASFVIATGLTRFSLLLWFGIALYFLLVKDRITAIGMATFAVIAFLPNLFVNFSGAFLPTHGASTWYEKLIRFPLSLIRMQTVEVGQLFVLDRIFLVALCFVFWLALRNFRNPSSILLLIVTLSLILTASLNGVLGVNFRYHLPLLPFAIAFLAQFQDKLLKFSK
jgi:hypothetical protein